MQTSTKDNLNGSFHEMKGTIKEEVGKITNDRDLKAEKDESTSHVKRREIMPQTVLERNGEHITESARKASRVTSAVADAIEDGVGTARRVVRQGGDAAEEFFDDTTKRLQRHPIETVITSLAIGMTVGIVIGWMMKRR